MSAEIKKSQDDLIKWLNTILDNTSSNQYLKSNADFQNLMLKEIYVLNLISSKNPEIKNDYEAIVKKYNDICPSNTFNLESLTQKVEEADIEDTIHYLPVYFKNIFHADINSMNASTVVQNANIQTQTSNDAQQGYGFNSNNITIPNPALIQKARQNINDKIINDQVEIFSSYPKYYPYLKIALGCTMILLGISLLIYSILIFALNGKDSGYHLQDGSSYSYHTLSIGMPNLIFVGFLLYAAYNIIKPFFVKGSITKKPSKNLTYQFPNAIVWIVLVSILVIIFGIWPDARIGDTIFKYHIKALQVYQPILTSACVVEIISLTILSIVSILTFFLYLLKPKQDYAKINQMLQAELNAIQNPMNVTPTTVTPIEPQQSEQKTESSESEIKN